MIRLRAMTIILLAIATSTLLAAEGEKKQRTSDASKKSLTSEPAFSILADFTGSANGASPLYGYPIKGTDGNGYGTTYGGGVYNEGTVFQATAGGALTTIYSFCSQPNCTDGAFPFSGLVQFGGNFYGTTLRGGVTGAGTVGAGTVFEVTPGGQLTTLHSFCSQTNCTDGAYPFSQLVQFGGNFYGTTAYGGANGAGTVFEITPSGQLTTLYSFCSQSGCADGFYPHAGLVQAGGNLYGTTVNGGANGRGGTVFEITPSGQLTTLYSFCSQAGCPDGDYPYAGLIPANGNLYGTTTFGGSSSVCVGCGSGTVFEISPGGQLTTLYSFCSQTNCADGANPYAGLIQASDGNFYGTTVGGGAYGSGTTFGIPPGGQLSTLHSFDLTDGASPDGGLLEGNNGELYGAASSGGTSFDGTIFSMPVGLDLLAEMQPSLSKAGASSIRRPALMGAGDPGLDGLSANSIIHRPDLGDPIGVRLRGAVAGLPKTKLRARELREAATGPMKMTAPSGNSKVTAQALTTLLNFDGANGDTPYNAPLIQGTDGNFYGTASGGGTYDQGTVFKMTPAGALTTLYTFCSQLYCTDGADPQAGLVQASDGNFYGTTYWGGAYAQGTVFKITPAGDLTTLYSFCSQTNCADGEYPEAGLVQASNGNLYGTTVAGGSTSTCLGCGYGTVFEITLAGQLTTLYSFCSQEGCADGVNPVDGLVQATDGNLYGTTSLAGAYGGGTVFGITPAGQLTTLYSFCAQTNCTDGYYPQAGLIQASDGNLYGTTYYGGANWANNNFGFGGTVFEISLTGQFNTLYSFCSQANCSDGTYPDAGLVQASDGNFYGTTEGGGIYYGICHIGCGTAFEITPAGQLTTLHDFNLSGGGYPYSGLLAANGNLYGSTGLGGSRFGGVIFSLPIGQQGLTLTPPSGTAQVGVAYNSSFVATGGVAPYTFSISVGALPPGLSLNTSTGAVTGTPTAAGTYNFTGQVVDSQNNTATTPSSSIVVSPPVLTLSGPTGTAQVGVAYSSALIASGGAPPYTFSIISGALPPGLSLSNPSTGAITGTPTTQGTFNFTAQVMDSNENTATANCSVTVTAAGVISTTTTLNLSPTSIPVGSVGPIVMTATAAPASGSGTPTGSVTYFNGSTQIGTVTLSSGVGTLNYNPSSLAVGIYSITAVYSGDSMFASSTSPAQTLGITQTGPFAYVANNGSNTVSVISIPTGQVTNAIFVASGPWGAAISPDQTQVYVTSNQGNSVSVINTANGSLGATIPVQSSPMGVAFTPDGSSVYVVNGGSNTVSVINVETQTVVATVPVGNSPVNVAMAPTSNGTFAYVTNSGSNTVSVIAVGGSPAVVATIPVGSGPHGVAVSPNSSLAYVENAVSQTVSVISVATNQVTATISTGGKAFVAAFTPDSSTAYVVNKESNTVSVIDTKSNTVIATVAGFNKPVDVKLTTDGTSAYVTNVNSNNVSVIATATNTITATVPVGNAPSSVAIASAPQTTLQITQPLSPTQPNTFNFGANNYTVQYPPGTQFSGVNMTVTAVEITQAQFQQRVAGTEFANATCIVYGGAAGNCIDDQVTCSNSATGQPVTCPSAAEPTIAVQTSFTTLQAIINPGYLTTPIGQNMWQNIFTGFSDPIVKGKTTGFSEFVAVDLGTTNAQGRGNFIVEAPLRPTDPRIFSAGTAIPVTFELTSIINPTQPVTDAVANITVVWAANANGQPESQTVLALQDAFTYVNGTGYVYQLDTSGYQPGTYVMTIYGNAFAAQQVQFTIAAGETFVLAVSPGGVTVHRGSKGTVILTIVPIGGFDQPVTLKVDNLPTGTTARFNRNPTTSTSTLTLRVGASAKTGLTWITISARSGEIRKEVAIWLMVI